MSDFPSHFTRVLATWALAAFATLASVPGHAQTLSTGGVEVRSFLAISSTNVYAATYGGGLWRSTDGSGSTWTRISMGSSNERYLTSIAGNSAGYLIVGAEEGLFRSTDGTTFTKVLHEPVAAVAVGPGTSTTVLAAVKGLGILRSTDSGTTFSQAANSAFDSTDMTAVAFDPGNASIVYASSLPDGTGSGGGVFRSADGGATWSAYSTGIDKSVTTLVVASNGTAYAGVLRLSDLQGDVYYRASGSASWTATGRFFGGISSLHRDSNSGNTIWGGGRGFGLQVGNTSSFDYTFTASPPNLFFTGVNAVATLPGTNIVLKAVKGAGVWRATNTTNPRNWTRVNTFAGADRVLSATNVASSNTTILAGLYAGGVWRSNDSGSTWSPPTVTATQADFPFGNGSSIPFLSIWELAASPTNPNLVYAAAGGVGMFYANDAAGLFRYNGTTWQGIQTAAVAAPYSIAAEPGIAHGAQIYGVALNRSDDNTAYASYLGGTFGIYRRLGGSWINTTPATLVPSTRSVVTSATPTKLLALSFDDKPMLSTNSGTTYTQVTISQSGFERIRFFAAAENPANQNQWIGATQKGIFYSGDGGVTWTRASMASTFSQLAVSAVGFDASGRAFAADFAGNRYCSANGGVTWTSAGSQLLAGVNSIRVIAGNLYYLTDGAGMVRQDGSC